VAAVLWAGVMEGFCFVPGGMRWVLFWVTFVTVDVRGVKVNGGCAELRGSWLGGGVDGSVDERSRLVSCDG
jgi:hypothetical protein